MEEMMKKYFYLGPGSWIEYSREMLKREEAYKFVSWSDTEVVLVASIEIDEKDFHHSHIVRQAINDGIIDSGYGDPNVYGAIQVDFSGNNGVNRICSWNSQSYGGTSEELRPQARGALELEDVIYKN